MKLLSVLCWVAGSGCGIWALVFFVTTVYAWWGGIPAFLAVVFLPFGLVFPFVYWFMEGGVPWMYLGISALVWVWWGAAFKLWPDSGDQLAEPIVAD